MFRSLFIGFLILSALTSKGVGVQINQNNTNISADMLLELFNAAAAYADKQAELSVAKPDGAFLSNTSGSMGAIEELLRPMRQGSPFVWVEPDDKNSSTYAQFSKTDLQQKQFSTGDVYSCGSDISPPHCRVDYQD